MSQFLGTLETVRVSRTDSRAHEFVSITPALHDDRPQHAPERSRVEQTVRYMAGHLTERLSVSQLAALVHVSPSHYFAIFKRQTGYAPLDFFIHLRMFRGCLLLDRTPLTVKEIAAELGYEDAFYFSRLFKLVSEVSPRDYRRLPAGVREGIRDAIIPAYCEGNRLSPNLNPWSPTRGASAVSH
jgi:AraC-like DNA-binding protein